MSQEPEGKRIRLRFRVPRVSIEPSLEPIQPRIPELHHRISGYSPKRVILTNAFSPTMLSTYFITSGKVIENLPYADVRFFQLSLDWVREYIRENKDKILCAIGHPATAMLMREITDLPLECRRIAITDFGPEDRMVMVVLGFRIPEGKVYTYQELVDLYRQGLIKFYGARIIS